MIVLIDLDDCVMDWSHGYDSRLDLHDDLAHVPRKHQRTVWNLMHGLDEASSLRAREILDSEGFYADLRPIDGAVEAVQRIGAKHDVFLVSTPWPGNPASSAEKVHSVRTHLGAEWASRLILTHDKTLVHGDLLIDDKTEITGLIKPSWTRIVYDQPWNKSTPGTRLFGWSVPQIRAARTYLV